MQQLIYETVVPVTAARHGRCAVQTALHYGFSRHLNSVPVMAAEFAPASVDHVLVFAETGTAGELVPVVLLGTRAGENLYLGAQDAWQAGYVPAFLRRYPFVFSTEDEGKTFTLCVDEAFRGLNWQAQGEALFNADGTPTAYVDGVLRFLQDYRREFTRTRELTARLQALDLFEAMQAQFTVGGGEKRQLGGFHVINRTRLNALDDATLADLVRGGELELVHLHLQSLRNFQALSQRLASATPPLPQAEAVGALANG